MKLSDLRKRAVKGIKRPSMTRKQEQRVKNGGKWKIVSVDSLKGPIKGQVIDRIDFQIVDDVLDEGDLSRDERRDLLTWYGD
jgi:hypothetical protein